MPASRRTAASCLSLLLLGIFAALPANAQVGGLLGYWRTPGGAVVRVAPCAQQVCATLEQLEPNPPTHFDTNNPDSAKHTQKLCGLRIGYGFEVSDPQHADGGHLYDPKSGKTYKGSMASNGNELSLRGYVGVKMFGRTEVWQRTKDVTTCRE